MTDQDTHLDTGNYDPRNYWEARARNSDNNPYQAVCAFQYLDCLNAAAETTQERYLHRLLRATGLTSGRALEFGCGVGRWAGLIGRNGLQFVGTDISESMISQARKVDPGAEFHLIDGVSLPFPDESFDLVFSVTVIHHNPFDRQDRILAEITRVLRRGGFLIMLEDVSRGRAAQPGFNMFIRSPAGWVQAVAGDGALRLLEMRLIRWWVFARPAARVLGSLYRLATGRPLDLSTQHGPYGRFVGAIVRLLSVLDVRLQPFVPRRLCSNAAMLFRKSD